MTATIKKRRGSKTFQLHSYELRAIKEFFEPRQNQVQIYTTNQSVCDFLVALGYMYSDSSTVGETYYFHIPEKFRCAFVTKQVTEFKTW